MRTTLAHAMLGALLASPLASQAVAQEVEPPAPATPPVTSGPANLSEAQAIVSRGERLSSQVGAMKTQAQGEKDIIRVNCLNTKLAEVNANLRNAKSRLEGLKSEADPQRLKQGLTVIGVLGQKFQLLDQEANQCLGQSVFETGQTKVDTSIDNALVPSEEVVDPTLVPEVVPPAQVGEVVNTAPPSPDEASPNGDEG